MLGLPQQRVSDIARVLTAPRNTGVRSLVCGEGVFIVTVSGDLEDALIGSFEHVVSSLLIRGADHVILDLRQVTSFGSAALDALRKLTTQPTPAFWLAPGPIVRRVPAAALQGFEVVETPYRAVSLIRSRNHVRA
jgi:hypothetical protein